MEATTRRSAAPSGVTLSVDEAGRIIDQLHLVALELMPYADDRTSVAGALLHAALADLGDVVRALEEALDAIEGRPTPAAPPAATGPAVAAGDVDVDLDLVLDVVGFAVSIDPVLPPTDHVPVTRAGAMADAERRLTRVWTRLAEARRPEADAVAAAGRLVLRSTHVPPGAAAI